MRESIGKGEVFWSVTIFLSSPHLYWLSFLVECMFIWILPWVYVYIFVFMMFSWSFLAFVYAVVLVLSWFREECCTTIEFIYRIRIRVDFVMFSLTMLYHLLCWVFAATCGRTNGFIVLWPPNIDKTVCSLCFRWKTRQNICDTQFFVQCVEKPYVLLGVRSNMSKNHWSGVIAPEWWITSSFMMLLSKHVENHYFYDVFAQDCEKTFACVVAKEAQRSLNLVCLM